MKIRFLGHSCVEIVGRHHILIDPDFTREPLPEVEYICITHAHTDHIGRVAEIPGGIILASPDVCKAAEALGAPPDRLHPVQVGGQVENVRILPGYSSKNNLIYTFFVLLIKHRLPQPSGTPLSFLIEDEVALLHIGDATTAPEGVTPDILCLPWRNSPYNPNGYKEILLRAVNHVNPRYVLLIHYDLPGTEADPNELANLVEMPVLKGTGWFEFKGGALITEPAISA